jgi:Tfp pilus assembly protein PilP
MAILKTAIVLLGAMTVATAMVSAQQPKPAAPAAKPAQAPAKPAAQTPAPAKPATPPVKPATPAPAPAAAAKPATPAPAPDAAKPAAPTPPAPETFVYDPGGRRDPFLNLVSASAEARNQRAKGEAGAAGMTISEISVRGVMQSRGRLVAMVMGPDNKTYIVHQGDKLADGSIKLITPQGLVIEQEVNDPLSVVKQREVRKLLRGLEDAK